MENTQKAWQLKNAVARLCIHKYYFTNPRVIQESRDYPVQQLSNFFGLKTSYVLKNH